MSGPGGSSTKRVTPCAIRGRRAGADGREFAGSGSVEGGVRGFYCFRRGSLRYTNGVRSFRTIAL